MLEMLINAIEELDEEKVLKIVKRCVAAGTPPKDIWMALNKGLEKVGLRYETGEYSICLLYTSPSPRDKRQSRMPSSA